MTLGMMHIGFMGAPDIARGWLRRARHILEDLEPTPIHGWVSLGEGFIDYLEGDVVVTCGDEESKGEPGTLAFLPKGVPHALRFGESTGARWLWISPRNRDDLFREAGVPTTEPEPAEDELDMERIIGIFEKNGMRFLEEDGH